MESLSSANLAAWGSSAYEPTVGVEPSVSPVFTDTSGSANGVSINTASPRNVVEVNLDEHGDVILKLQSSHEGRMAHFRVNSKVLCLASPVFQATFGQNSQFIEDITSAREDGVPPEPIEVSLPDGDDPDAFVIVLRILHLQFDWVPKRLQVIDHDEEKLYKIAIICNKYQLQKPLSYWFKRWAHPEVASKPRSCRVFGETPLQTLSPMYSSGPRWIFMAYAFGHRNYFRRLTRDFILESHVGSNGELYVPGLTYTKFDEYMPQAVIEALLTARQKGIEAISDCLAQLVDQYYVRTGLEKPKCQLNSGACDAITLGTLLREFGRLRLPPTVDHSGIITQSILAFRHHIHGITFFEPNILRSGIGCCLKPTFREQCSHNLNFVRCSPVCTSCINCFQRFKPIPQHNHLPTCSPLSKLFEQVDDIVDQIKGLEYDLFRHDLELKATGLPPPVRANLWRSIEYP